MRFLPAGALISVLSIAECSARKGDMNPAALVPAEISGWRAAGEDQRYDRETIFRYIDGAGEVYLQYGFREVLVRVYARADAPGITAQLFDMGTSEEAFGIFSFEREDESVGIGVDSEYAAGLLRFWKGRFFVCVSAEAETPESQSAVIEIGKAISGAIGEQGDRPRILAILPDEGLRRTTVRYFHTPFCLTYHYPVGDQNPLGLGESTEGLLASYRTDAGSARLVVIRYPTEDASARALASLAGGYTPALDKDGYAQKQDGRWAGARIAGRVLLAVFDTTTRSQAEALLARAARKLEGMK